MAISYKSRDEEEGLTVIDYNFKDKSTKFSMVCDQIGENRYFYLSE